MKKGKLFSTIVLILLLSFTVACGSNTPPDGGTAAPNPYRGTFVSSYGTMIFNGDGESITFDLVPDMATTVGLPSGKTKGTYVFLFHNAEWRYDKAESFRITVGDVSYDFNNVFTLTNENTVAVLSPMNAEEVILFKKE